VIELQGRIKKIRWASASWMIAVVSPRDEVIAAVGPFPPGQEGEDVTLKGDWVMHPKYGEQFKVTEAVSRVPQDAKGKIGFLTRLANLGPQRAQQLVETFGDDVFNVIEHEPDKLLDVPGLTPDRVQALRASYAEYKERRETIVALKGVGMTDWQIGKVVEKFGKRAVDVVTHSPYALTTVKGFGFKQVDAIALATGVDRQGVPRTKAAIQFALFDASHQGHCYLPGNEVARRVQKLAGIVNADRIKQAGTELKDDEKIIVREIPGDKDRAVYLAELAEYEDRVADWVRARRKPVAFMQGVEVPLERHDSEGKTLNVEQALLVELALDYDVPLFVGTGGPGTGKTTTVRTIVEEATKRGEQVLLCSPTGKAAKRLKEASGHEAKTIHRTLAFDPETGGWLHDHTHPLEADLILVDESSMLDVRLCADLMAAIQGDTRVGFIGDVDQLPSIGPGNVLKDMILSGRVPVVRLEQVYRQSESSYIHENAKRMREGKDLFLDPNATDFFWLPCDDSEAAFRQILTLCSETIPARHTEGVDPIRDVHVLAPQRQGPLGIEKLNQQLQPLMNPVLSQQSEVKLRGMPVHAGDKVRHTRNNYDLGVMNGEVGIVETIEFQAGGKAKRPIVSVDFGDRVVTYQSNEDLADLVLNFAGTIHASQGSEYPVVVIACHSTNHFMLSRNLVYTAMTRAKHAVYLVGDEKGLRRAVRNTDVARRFTQLTETIRKEEG
jgi:exodeoxyribonuclease V alpha subunit